MKTNTLQFRLEGFRAVHKACIDLQGMTVLTGPGGSGKTTLANYLHRLIYGLGVYDERAGEIPQKEMFGSQEVLYHLVTSFFPYKFRNIMKNPDFRHPLNYQEWKKLLKKLRETYELALSDYPQMIKTELWKICPDEIDHLLEEMKLDLSPEGIDFPTLIDHLEAYLELLKEKSDHIIHERPITYFYEVMHYFPDNLLSSSWFSLQQGRKTIIAKGQDSIGKLVSGQKSYFINSDTFGYPVFEGKLPELHSIPDRILAKLQEVIQGELVVKKSLFNPETVRRKI
ncbi:MAG: hypothetical protein LUG51_09955 [Tannerellaceae bacterium]|nr:hypothetical protein [Tannerellaceae bacterium]